MGPRRTVILMAAVVVAAIAAVATYSYLSTVQDRANQGAKLVKILKIKHPIAKGMTGEEAVQKGYIQPDQINFKFHPVTAITSTEAIRGLVALTDLAPNQVLVQGQFVDPVIRVVTQAQRIADGKSAVSGQFDNETGVAGLIQPGDLVNMVIDFGSQERYLLQNVKVLFVGGKGVPQPGSTPEADQPENVNSTLLAFELAPDDAARFIRANQGDQSNIYLTLVPPDNQPVEVPAIDDESLIENPVQTG